MNQPQGTPPGQQPATAQPAAPAMDPSKFSAALKALGQAIASHPQPPQVAFCGLKLYCDAIASGRVVLQDFMMETGQPATRQPDEKGVKIPVLSIGGRIPLSFDPMLPPEGFRLAP